MTPPLVIPPYLKEAPLTGLIGMGGGATSRRFYTASSSDETYNIEKSLKFYDDDVPILKRTPTFPGDRRKWTWAAWVKRSKLDDHQCLFSIYTGTSNNTGYIDCNFQPGNTFQIGGWTTCYLRTNRLFRDTSAWTHIVVAVDTTHEVSTERVQFYINGVRETSFDTQNQPAQNTEWPINHTSQHGHGGNIYYSTDSQKLSGYLADLHFISGQTLNASAFGSFLFIRSL